MEEPSLEQSGEAKSVLLDSVHFAETVKQYDRITRAVIARILSSKKQGAPKHLVDDLAQETWLRVWRFRDSYDPTRKFSTWLCQIARNITVDYFRKNARRHTVEDETVLENEPSPDSDALENVIAMELSHTVARLVSEMLPPYLAETLEDELSTRTTEEIAALRGLQKPTVQTRRYKLRQALLPLLPEDFR